MARIDSDLTDFISKTFRDRNVKGYFEYHTWQASRYIQMSTVIKDDFDIHYEFYQDHVELHLEGKYQSDDYRGFVKFLRIQSSRIPDLKWISWQGRSQCRCQYSKVIGDKDDLVACFNKMISIFDRLIESAVKERSRKIETTAYSGETEFHEVGLGKDEVSLETACLGKIFANRLVIPDYQRNYCWGQSQVQALWANLHEMSADSPYHLGTIILQKDDESGTYSIIDGQQRLVTLTLLLDAFGYEGPLPLLDKSFNSVNSSRHIANNKWQINQLIKNLHDDSICRKIVDNLVFSVLILKENRLDLAYTFFSNQNSKGLPLSDFDILKAHHLRYVCDERLAEHVAGRWDSMIEDKYELLDKTLSTHVYRLRKWMRKRDYDPRAAHRVKEEYSAAAIVSEIPVYGGSLNFNEKIQGGAFFFAYAENLVMRFKEFLDTEEVISLRSHFQWESHWKYEDVIETLLFGYYLKFGVQYLTEALFCITAYIAQHRFTSRAILYKILEYAKDSEIIMMIDQASSPSFFLEECSSRINTLGSDIETAGIELRFYQHMQDMFDELRESRHTTLFKFA